MVKEGERGIEELLEMLQAKDGLVRQKGRVALTELGESAVPGLCRILLNSPSKDARWGAAKALGEIRSPEAAPALLDALEDRNADVAWLAAAALNRLGREAWKPVLQRLVERGVDSVAVRDGVHHVLKGQTFDRYADLFRTVVSSLEFGELDEAGSLAATEILRLMLDDLWQECRDIRDGEPPATPGPSSTPRG
jgi:HEAT repeat protein